jgi:hypothetical protein
MRKYAIRTDSELYRWINAARRRADHHGHKINLIVDPLARIVFRKADELSVRVNQAWLTFGEQKYALKYKRPEGVIELRRGNTLGPVVATFTNATAPSTIAAVFDSL